MYALTCVFLFVSLAAWDRIPERFSNFLSVDDYESINGCLFLYKTFYKIHSSVCLFVCLFVCFLPSVFCVIPFDFLDAYFIGEYALSLCEYSSKPSMEASASGGTLKPSVIFSVTNKHA